MKMNYRNENVYSMDMLTDVISSSDDITVHRVQTDRDFVNIDKYLGGYYKRFPKIDGHHIFSCKKDDCKIDKVLVTCKEGDMSDAFSEQVNMLKKLKLPLRNNFRT